MNTSPTPETDAEVKRIRADRKIFVSEEMNCLAAFTRKLERERNELSWVPITERLPTEEDADEYGDVDWSDGVQSYHCSFDKPFDATHWRRIVLP